MAFDHRVYRNKDGIGTPSDEPAANSTEDNTIVSLFKGLYVLLTAGNSASATAALQTAGNTTLTAIDGHVDGLETTSAAILVQETAVNAVLGTTAGAAVTTSVAGTIQGYLRGIVSLLVSGITVATHAVTQSGTWAATANASAATGGIASTKRLLSAGASTNADFAKASAGRLYAVHGYNAATTVRYLKLYNKASAPTVGTDVPVKTIALPPSCGFALDWPHGYSFATGIAFALTTGSADADTGALTAADVLGLNLDYV